MVRVLVVTGFGINCDAETAAAFERAGAAAKPCHVNALAEQPGLLDDAHILAVPGGFSFGDDVASGRILANRLRYRLGGALERFLASGKLAIGICNGFQVLVKMGLLPMTQGRMEQEVTLTHNDSDRYEDRWVRLATDPTTPCVWLTGIDSFEVPVRHGEGKFVVPNGAMLQTLRGNGLVALRYVHRSGKPADGAYPANPNGSDDDIAGICDPSGRILGLMPHPEAFVDGTNHPRWTRDGLQPEGEGLALFKNAVAYASEHLTAGATV